jgi:hypothetical protein
LGLEKELQLRVEGNLREPGATIPLGLGPCFPNVRDRVTECQKMEGGNGSEQWKAEAV